MPSPLRLMGPLGLGVLALLANALAASDSGNAGDTTNGHDLFSLRDLFDFQLPQIVWPEALRLSVNPAWRDFISKDSVRVRLGAHYGVTEHLEGSAEIVTYFDNLRGNGTGGLGIAQYRIGGKWAWNAISPPDADTAVGFDFTLPAPAAPADMTIGTASVAPYVVFSRDSHAVAGLSSFVNLGYELFDSDPPPERIARYRPARDNFSLTPGWIWHRARWQYTLAVSLRSTLPSGHARQYVSLLPSALWAVPSRYVFQLPGSVVAGVGLETILFNGGTAERLTGQLKWDFDWRKAVRDHVPWANGFARRWRTTDSPAR